MCVRVCACVCACVRVLLHTKSRVQEAMAIKHETAFSFRKSEHTENHDGISYQGTPVSLSGASTEGTR